MAEVNSMIQNKVFGVIAACIDDTIDLSLLEQNHISVGSYTIKTDVCGRWFHVTVWI